MTHNSNDTVEMTHNFNGHFHCEPGYIILLSRFFLPPLVMKWVIGMRGELTLADIGLLKDSYMCVPVCDV